MWTGLVYAVAWACGVCLLSGAALAAEPITLTIDATKPGCTIPSTFVGISVSTMGIDGNSGYSRYFTTANTQMVNLFRQIGIKHLRTIMGKAEPKRPDPAPAQIDAFFDFANAASVSQIIWSLHLFNATPEHAADWSNNKAVAAHIWNTTTAGGTVERNLIESFAFDNEPDWLRYMAGADPEIKGYYKPAGKGYIDRWRHWHQAIAAPGVAPGARFSGPDTGSKWPAGQAAAEINTQITGTPFTLRFAMDEASSISVATQHFYGQNGGKLTALQMATACLSANWLTTNYALLYLNVLAGFDASPGWPKTPDGSPLPYRFTECSPFTNAKNPANHCFATALWGLDFYHWWAMHGCAGVNPFTRTVQYNSPIYFDHTNYIAEPYAYGMKAFNLGSNGKVILPGQFVVSNLNHINVTAYGVVNSNHLYVTVINKTFDSVGSRAVDVSIPSPTGFTVKQARYIVLSGGSAPGSSGNATMNGACLGGAEIPNDGSSWAGTWTTLPVSGGGVRLPVLPTTAVIIELQNY